MLKKIFFLFLFLSEPVSADRQDDIAEFNAAFAEYQNQINNTGDIDAAILAAEEVYKLAPRLYGRKSEEYAIVTYNLAELHDLKGGEEQNENEEKASNLYEKYFRMQNLNKIPKDIEYINQYMPYMIAYYNAHPGNARLEVSEKLLEYAYELNLPKVEMADLEFLVGVKRANFIGRDYSLENFEKALSLYNQDNTVNAYKIGETLYWIAQSYQKAKTLDIAFSKLQESLKALESSIQDTREIKNTIFFDLAVINVVQKDLEDAKSNYERIVIAEDEKAFALPIFKPATYEPLQDNDRKFIPAVVHVQFDINLDGTPINIEVIEMDTAGGNAANVSMNPRKYKSYAIEKAARIKYLPPFINGENKIIEKHKEHLIFMRAIL